MAVTSPLGDDKFLVSAVSWQETMGRPFQGVVTLLSDDDAVAPSDLVGQPLSILLDRPSQTYLHGIVSEFSYDGAEGSHSVYTAHVVPWFSLLRFAGGNKIFQQQTAVDIFKAVVDTRGFSGMLEDKLTGTYRTRPFCVQYAESDFHFLSRLLEEEGIYYFFQYTDEGHTLVLADDVSAHPSIPENDSLDYYENDSAAPTPRAFAWRGRLRYGTTNFVMRDYDFQKPRAEMTVRQSDADSICPWSWYQYPGRYFDPSDGDSYVRVRSEAAVATSAAGAIRTNVPMARSGNRFTLQSHPLDDVNQEYLISQASIRTTAGGTGAGGSSGGEFHCQLFLHPSSKPFHASPTTRKPLAAGPQLATVVGKSGEEIWTDSYGRIKVQFAWDLDASGDDTSSCWIRVVQPWTGKGYGAISIPRVGEEVIVQFIDGDIDRPIVTGRVHNADRMPPETLADNQAKTVFRTRSTKGGDVDAFHELTFDDTKDSESIYFHSERDFSRVVENNDTLKVGFDKQDPGDQTIEVYNNQDVKIGVGSSSGSQTIEVGQDRDVTIDSGDDTLTIKQGDHTIDVQQGDQSITVEAGDQNIAVSQGDQNIKVDQGKISIEAGTSITLKCGQSEIEITPSAINIRGGEVNVVGQSKASISAPDVSAAADGQLKLSGNVGASLQSSAQLGLKGGIVQIN